VQALHARLCVPEMVALAPEGEPQRREEGERSERDDEREEVRAQGDVAGEKAAECDDDSDGGAPTG
jgi:hypothetical protein